MNGVDPEAQAETALHKLPYPALHLVSCQHKDGVLRLIGNVPSFYLKQIAQETAAKIPGVQRVRNELIVESQE